MLELTKDADKVICYIYKEYLERRKHGISKSEAKEFDGNFYINVKALSNWSSADMSDTIQELHDKGFIKKNVIGDFSLLNSTVIYMENRFKKGLEEITDFISKFIP